MSTNLSVEHSGGFLPDIILLTQCYYHRRTRLNAMDMFCICSLRSHLNVLTFSPLTGECSEELDAFRFFFKNKHNPRERRYIIYLQVKCPDDTSSRLLWLINYARANQHEPSCFGLSSSRYFLSRLGILLHAVVQPWFFLHRSISPRNITPLVPPSYAIPARPGL